MLISDCYFFSLSLPLLPFYLFFSSCIPLFVSCFASSSSFFFVFVFFFSSFYLPPLLFLFLLLLHHHLSYFLGFPFCLSLFFPPLPSSSPIPYPLPSSATFFSIFYLILPSIIVERETTSLFHKIFLFYDSHLLITTLCLSLPGRPLSRRLPLPMHDSFSTLRSRREVVSSGTTTEINKPSESHLFVFLGIFAL